MYSQYFLLTKTLRNQCSVAGTATKSVNGTEDRPQAQGQPDLDIHRIRNMEISKGGPVGDTAPAAPPKSYPSLSQSLSLNTSWHV